MIASDVKPAWLVEQEFGFANRCPCHFWVKWQCHNHQESEADRWVQRKREKAMNTKGGY